MTRKYGENTDRDALGRFTSGNPGRRRGSRNRATLAAQSLIDNEARALSRRAVELALDGDTTALRLCLERIVPPRKDSPVRFACPKMSSASDAVTAMGSIVRSVAEGDLTPQEGAAVAGLIETFRRSFETEDLERRLKLLEE